MGRDHLEIGAVDAVAEGAAALAISRGGARKQYAHSEPNEDAALFAMGPGGAMIAVADGHEGARGAERVIEYLLEVRAPVWTASETPSPSREAWLEQGLDALVDAGNALLADAGKRGTPPAPTTLSLALVRPDQDLLLHASVGDSHVFAAEGHGVLDLGWAARSPRRSWFLGLETESRENLSDRSRVECASPTGLRAVVLATDGLSERGIGVADPAAAVADALDAAAHLAPDLRPLEASKGVVGAALEAQRRQGSGDNTACAVLWLAS